MVIIPNNFALQQYSKVGVSTTEPSGHRLVQSSMRKLPGPESKRIRNGIAKEAAVPYRSATSTPTVPSVERKVIEELV